MFDLLDHTESINRLLARYGVKFGIYKDGVFKEQLFPFDPIPRIITPEEFDKGQAEFERRKRISRQYSGKSIFLPASSAGTVAPTSAQNSGTRPQNTAGSSGNATANSRENTNAKHPI